MNHHDSILESGVSKHIMFEPCAFFAEVFPPIDADLAAHKYAYYQLPSTPATLSMIAPYGLALPRRLPICAAVEFECPPGC